MRANRRPARPSLGRRVEHLLLASILTVITAATIWWLWNFRHVQ